MVYLGVIVNTGLLNTSHLMLNYPGIICWLCTGRYDLLEYMQEPYSERLEVLINPKERYSEEWMLTTWVGI